MSRFPYMRITIELVKYLGAVNGLLRLTKTSFKYFILGVVNELLHLKNFTYIPKIKKKIILLLLVVNNVCIYLDLKVYFLTIPV